MITINKLKNCLINHPDYNKLGTTNIEESINMLKFFIYIDKGGVHLKGNNINNNIFILYFKCTYYLFYI